MEIKAKSQSSQQTVLSSEMGTLVLISRMVLGEVTEMKRHCPQWIMDIGYQDQTIGINKRIK